MENKDKILLAALVPMKAHSERVPNKNIRDFLGRPLFYYIIETLSKSEYIKDIYINTDSNRISEEAPKVFEKVNVIERPLELRGDLVSMNKVIGCDVSQIDYQFFLQTHVTNPLLKTETIDRAIELLFNSLDKYDSLFAVTKTQSRFFDHNFKPINHDPSQLLRSQDLSPMYEENSNFYIFSKNSFMNKQSRIGEKPLLFEVNKLEAIDIDTIDDFKLAEAVMTTWKK